MKACVANVSLTTFNQVVEFSPIRSLDHLTQGLWPVIKRGRTKIFRFSCRTYYSYNFLGLQISPLQLRWMTERFNRSIIRFGSHCPGLLRTWFCLGSVISSLLILPSIYLLVSSKIHFHYRRCLNQSTVPYLLCEIVFKCFVAIM